MRFQIRPCRLDSPAEARRLMEAAGVSESGIELMTPKLGFHTVHITGLPFTAATILKQEALAVGAEAAVHRGMVVRAVDATDVVLGGSRAQLDRLCAKLLGQQFGLGTLAEELGEVIDALASPRRWLVRGRELSLRRPLLMGILNLTEDSFSGDGVGDDQEAALGRAVGMLEAGATIIDVGAESSRPGAEPLHHEDELARLLPVVRRLAGETGAVISVDTCKPEVARACLEAGAHIINDITALRGPEGTGGMAAVCAEYDAGVVLMHMKGTPKDMQRDPGYDDLAGELFDFFARRVEAALEAGFHEESLALDPGIGFGKRLEDNLTLLNHLEWFAGFGRPLVIGASRKSFIGALTGAPVAERLPGTLAAHTVALLRGADVLRVHDVPQARQALEVAEAIAGTGQ